LKYGRAAAAVAAYRVQIAVRTASAALAAVMQ